MTKVKVALPRGGVGWEGLEIALGLYLSASCILAGTG
jgi:hypothetical protein